MPGLEGRLVDCTSHIIGSFEPEDRLRRINVSRSVAETAIAALPRLFCRADSPASVMAADAATPVEPRNVIAASCAGLVAELRKTLG
ncbi:MAG: hypothetical protein GX113_11640 [Actinobacteria bacterium]|nr:hypothetical protein [Actinomycetota bacterium]